MGARGRPLVCFGELLRLKFTYFLSEGGGFFLVVTMARVFKRGFNECFWRGFVFFPMYLCGIDKYTMAGQRMSKHCACVRVSEQGSRTRG